MQISPGLGVAIMMNNYFHDVATALLAASGFTLYALFKVQAVMGDVTSTLYFLRVQRRMVRFFHGALLWIVVGGVPRTIFYTSFEWANAADKLQVPALMVKHLLMVILIVWGVYAWRRMKIKVAELHASLPADVRDSL